MLAAGIKTPVPLEELEIHLREEIDQQMKSGLKRQEAFNSAVQKIGQCEALNSEFKKNKQKKPSAIITAFRFTMGLSFIFAGIIQWQTQEIFSGWNAFQILGGIVIIISGVRDVVHGVKNRRGVGSEK